MHWLVIGLAWVLHHQQSITRIIVKYIYQPRRLLVADDLLSPVRKQVSSNLSLFLMLLLFFFLQKILLPKLWSQAAVLNLRLSSNPLQILPNVRGLLSNFAIAYKSKASALPSSRRQHSARRLPIKQDGLVYKFPCDSVKFTFGWDWKPWQGRVIMIMS